jgi:hypothetical protein
MDHAFSNARPGRTPLQDLYLARTPSVGGLSEFKVVGLILSGDGGKAVSPGLVEYVPLGESCTLFSFSVRSRDVPRPLEPFDSSRWVNIRGLAWDVSCRLRVDGRGVVPGFVAPRKLPADACSPAVIWSLPDCAPPVLFSPLLVLAPGGGDDCGEPSVDASGESQEVFVVGVEWSASWFVAKARVNKEVEFDRDSWVHERLFLVLLLLLF